MTKQQEKMIVESIGKAYQNYLRTRDEYDKKAENPHMREVEGMAHIIAVLNIPYETEWDIERRCVKRFTLGDTTIYF